MVTTPIKCIMRNVILVILVILTFGINDVKLESKRYYSSAICFPPVSLYCHISCANGLRTGYNGCPVCQCAASPQQSSHASAQQQQSAGSAVPTQTPFSSLNQQFHPGSLMGGFTSMGGKYQLPTYTNPCLPQQMYCSLQCDHGYVTGNNGCHFCFCATPSQPTTVTTTTQATYVYLPNACVSSHSNCSKTCTYGFLKGPGNCDYCICSSKELQMITYGTTTVPTTTRAPDTALSNPCMSGQTVCTMSCAYGLLRGPNDCQYCLCAPKSLHTTPSSAQQSQTKPHDNHDAHVTTPVSPDIKNECVIAITICQMKCKGGFMTDPNQCTFCICKDQIYNQTGIVKAEEPIIQLMNPCVEGLDICRIFCSEGYLRGPKNCQYCACRK